MNAEEIKTALLEQCSLTVGKRYQQIKQTIKGIEESLFEESKSSAGDKHETGRAMLQIDRENAGKQLREIELLMRTLPQINIKTSSEHARLGSLVYTDKATYFLSLSIGDIILGKSHYFCVAIGSPIGQQLLGKKQGEQIVFNHIVRQIMNVE